MALANMGLDLIGQARELYSYAGEVEGKGHDEDKLAYLRDVRQYRNLLLVEQPNGDFAQHHGAALLLFGLRRSLLARDDAHQGRDAGRDRGQVGEGNRLSRPPFRRNGSIRLGDGTDESHRRAQTAIDELWAFTGEIVRDRRQASAALIDAGIAVDPATSARAGRRRSTMWSSEATLTRAAATTGCRAAAAAAGTASISAIS